MSRRQRSGTFPRLYEVSARSEGEFRYVRHIAMTFSR
jgi:hypothetical protein